MHAKFLLGARYVTKLKECERNGGELGARGLISDSLFFLSSCLSSLLFHHFHIMYLCMYFKQVRVYRTKATLERTVVYESSMTNAYILARVSKQL